MKPILILLAILAVLAVLVIAALLLGNWFFHFTLDRTSLAPPAEPEGALKRDQLWLDGVSQPRKLTSRDGLALAGRYVPGGRRTVVICHGYKRKGANMATYARRFSEMGYSVLLPDARSHGESEGRYLGMGWPERFDLCDWCRQLAEAAPESEIAIMGVSMGAATVLCATGEALPAQVKAAVEDCGYTTGKAILTRQIHTYAHLPQFPIVPAASLMCRIQAGYFFGQASPLKQVKKSSTPTLFLHGGEDKLIPPAMMDTLYSAAACPKERLLVPGAGHSFCSRTNPELYWSTVTGFLDRYFSPEA